MLAQAGATATTAVRGDARVPGRELVALVAVRFSCIDSGEISAAQQVNGTRYRLKMLRVVAAPMEAVFLARLAHGRVMALVVNLGIVGDVPDKPHVDEPMHHDFGMPLIPRRPVSGNRVAIRVDVTRPEPAPLGANLTLGEYALNESIRGVPVLGSVDAACMFAHVGPSTEVRHALAVLAHRQGTFRNRILVVFRVVALVSLI
jgi:hypothetical protein